MAEGPIPIDLSEVRRKFGAMRKALRAHFHERSEAVDVAQVSMVSGTNPLYLGPPGTAKSAVFNAVLSCVRDARRQSKLITQFTTEDELIGPPKLSGLKRDVFERNLDGGLAGVEVAFLDEVFKGSSSILNTALTCINERTYNGKDVPLRMCVAASNELPTDEILGAVNDRFLLRAIVDDLVHDGSFEALLADAANPAKRKLVPAQADMLTLAEWDAARDAASLVTLPDGVRAECVRIRREVKAKGVYVSPRRWTQLVRVLQAQAWLDDSPEVEVDHLTVLKYGLWTKMDDRKTVAAVVDTIDAGVIGKIVKIADDALRLAEGLSGMDPDRRRAALAGVAVALKDAGRGIQGFVAQGASKRAKAKAAEKQGELRAAHDALKAELSAHLL